MTAGGPQTGPLVAGSVVLGGWVFLALSYSAGTGDAAWMQGGLLAAAAAGLTYAARYTTAGTRTAPLVVVGLVAGFAVMAAIAMASVAFPVSFLFAALGGLLIVSGLPHPPPRQSRPEQGQAEEASA